MLLIESNEQTNKQKSWIENSNIELNRIERGNVKASRAIELKTRAWTIYMNSGEITIDLTSAESASGEEEGDRKWKRQKARDDTNNAMFLRELMHGRGGDIEYEDTDFRTITNDLNTFVCLKQRKTYGECGYVNYAMMLFDIENDEQFKKLTENERRNAIQGELINAFEYEKFDKECADEMRGLVVGEKPRWIGAGEVCCLLRARRYFALTNAFQIGREGVTSTSDSAVEYLRMLFLSSCCKTTSVMMQYEGHSVTILGVDLNSKLVIVCDPIDAKMAIKHFDYVLPGKNRPVEFVSVDLSRFITDDVYQDCKDLDFNLRDFLD